MAAAAGHPHHPNDAGQPRLLLSAPLIGVLSPSLSPAPPSGVEACSAAGRLASLPPSRAPSRASSPGSSGLRSALLRGGSRCPMMKSRQKTSSST